MDDHRTIGPAGASKADSTSHPDELYRRSQASWPIDRHGFTIQLLKTTNDPRDRWSVFHFSLASPRGPDQGDVAALLERLASALRELGDVTVQDITFEIEANEDGNWPSFTVYYDRESNSD